MDSWLAVAATLAVATFTPGPNNFIVLEAGARGGLRAAAGPAAGVLAGSLLLLALAWTGAAAVFEAEPRLRALLTLAGAAWLGFTGWSLARPAAGARHPGGRPPAAALPRHWAAVGLFQLVNPKAWGLMVTATAAVGGGGPAELAALALLLAALSAAGLALWSAAGSLLEHMPDAVQRRFDRVSGLALLASAATMAAQAF